MYNGSVLSRLDTRKTRITATSEYKK